jgi:predicted nucleotide-binding protein
MKFTGSIQDLKSVIIALGRNISSSVDKENMHQIKTKENETISFFDTGTVQIQAKPEIKKKFEYDFNQYTGINNTVLNKSKEVFIVHGHDDIAKEQLELVLHKFGLEPFILANTGGQGLTIIETLESKIGANPNQTSFGIVLMTPDDMGYAVNQGDSTIKSRARQNVVLEMGMLISSIGRQNIAILIKGNIEKPSDSDGIVYIAFDKHVKETVPKLANRLQNSGFVLDSDQIINASS